MEPGRGSGTAVFVAMGRALADGRTAPGRFADPTARALLSDARRAEVDAIRGRAPPRGVAERIRRLVLGRLSDAMVARTVEVDDAIRAAPTAQVVILGAGLDGRAWRMAELAGATVFEVDHPDTQRAKRARVAGLPQVAAEVRFVAVDFTRDDLGVALAAAGHDAARPTTWIWEGVVMYLVPAAIEATLRVIAARAAAGSRLVVVYASPALRVRLLGLVAARLGEPFRSAQTPDAMAALLARHGFAVVRDVDVARVGGALDPALGRRNRAARHLRMVTAERRATGAAG